MSKPTRNTRGRKILVALVVVVALLAGGYVGYYFITKPDRRDIGNGIVIEGNDLPNDLRSAVVDPEAALPTELKQFKLASTGQDWAKRISKVYDIGPSGPLKSPMRVEVPVDSLPSDESHHVLAAFSGPTGNPDAVEEVTIVDMGIRPDGQAYVTVELNHLSILGIFESVTEVIGGATVKVFDFFGADVVQDAELPKCRNEVSSKEYSIRIDGSPDAMFSCLDRDKSTGKLKLHVVDNRRYPLKLKPTDNMHPDGQGALKFDLIQLQKLLGSSTLIRPREEAAFTLDALKDGESATVIADVDNQALFLYTLYTTAGIVLEAMNKGNDLTGKLNVLDKVLKYTECSNAGLENMPEDLPKLLGKCFNGEVLREIGAQSVSNFMGRVFAVMDVSDLTRSWSNFIGDSKNGRTDQTLVIKRNKVAASSLTGYWERHGGSVTFEGGSARIRIGQGDESCGISGQSCSLFLRLSLARGDNRAEGTVTDVWYGPGVEPEPRIEGLPPAMFEDTLTVGDRYTLSVDEHGVLQTVPHAAGYNNGDLDGDGVLDDANMYCNGQTQDAYRSPCGA